MTRALPAALAAGLWAFAAAAADSKEIEAAIQKGVDYITERQAKDGSWSHGEVKDHSVGITALSALALFENGALAGDERIRNALEYVRENVGRTENTYSVALATILLARIGNRDDRILVRSLADRIMAAQYQTGGWGYDVPKITRDQARDRTFRDRKKLLGDLSCTQFAAVALWQASRQGADVGDAMERLRQRLAWSQTTSGGWEYHGIPDLPDSPSMTTAGTFLWVVSSAVEIRRARARGKTEVVARQAKARRDGKGDGKAGEDGGDEVKEFKPSGGKRKGNPGAGASPGADSRAWNWSCR